jgi:hypothetical protein
VSRLQRPPTEAHGWVVEIWSNKRGEWYLAQGAYGQTLFVTLAAARAFRAELRSFRHSRTGRREFPTVRVRRGILKAWGCAV